MTEQSMTQALQLMRRGVELAASGRHREAVDTYRMVIGIEPGIVEAHANLSVSLASLGDTDGAVSSLRLSIALRPDIPDLHSNLARLCARRGDLPTALQAARRHLRLTSLSPIGLLGLGSEHARLHKRMEAVRFYRAAAVCAPWDEKAYHNMASLLTERLDRDAAVAAARRAVRIRPDLASVQHGLSASLERRGDIPEAETVAKRSLVLDPGLPEGWAHLSTIRMVLGQFSPARAAIVRALTLSPAHPRYYRGLTTLTSSWPATDPWLQAMKSLIPSLGDYDQRDQAELHFALAKVYEDRGEADLRFDHLRTANALMRRTMSYDEAATLGMFDALKRTITAEYLARRAGPEPASDKPIFIIGMPRSGTSLAEQILSSHSQVFGAGESPLFSQLLRPLLQRKVQAMDLAFEELTAETYRDMGRTYLAHMNALAPSAAHIVDKMPANFMYAGLIHLAMPNARFIHMRRDPVDNCMSCFAQLFADGQEYSYDLAELGRYYRGYESLMEHWRNLLPKEVFLEVQYEDLVRDFEPQVKRILSFAHLEWEDSCLSFHRNDRAVRTASATQVRRPLYQTSVGKLRPDSRKLAPLIEALQG